MSTYYYIVCDDHRERTDAASRAAGGPCPLADGPHTLIPFIIAHCNCNVRIVSEHDDDACSDDYRDWTEENVGDEIQKAKDDGRFCWPIEKKSEPLPPLVKSRNFRTIEELDADYRRMTGHHPSE